MLGCPSTPVGGGGPLPGTCTDLSGTISTDTTLSDTCYDVTADVTVDNNATLTIAAGTTLTFTIDTRLQINDDGTLIAVGTATDPITLTGAQQIRGFWNGIYFRDTISFNTVLDYVTVEYGGGVDFFVGAQGNVVLQGFSSATPVRANITHCILRESSPYGFYFDGEAEVPDFSNNTVTANTLGAGYVSAATVGILDTSGSYTGNDVDAVFIDGATMDTAQTIAAIDVDYQLMDRFIIEAALTVEAGTRLVFQLDATVEVRDTGSLTAVGTMADPIVFTGLQQTPGYWGGIYFRDSNFVENQFDYCTVEYAGSWDFAFGAMGNIVARDFGTNDTVRINVTNSTIQHSSSYGIWVGNKAVFNADIQTINTYANNATADFFQDP